MNRTFHGDPTGLQNKLIAWRSPRRRQTQSNDAGSYDHSSRKRLATKLKHRLQRAIAVTTIFPDHLQLEVWRVRKAVF